MNYEPPVHKDPVCPDDSPGKSRKVHPGFVASKGVTPVRDVTGTSTTALIGDYMNLQVSISIIILAVTPVFGGYTGWMFFSAAVLAAALGISFLMSRWKMSSGLHASKGGRH